MKKTPTLEAIIFQGNYSDNEIERIKQSILSLPLEYHQPIQLHYFNNLSRKQIAEELNWSYSKVHNRITRGVTLLKAELNPGYFNQMRELATALYMSSSNRKAFERTT